MPILAPWLQPTNTLAAISSGNAAGMHARQMDDAEAADQERVALAAQGRQDAILRHQWELNLRQQAMAAQARQSDATLGLHAAQLQQSGDIAAGHQQLGQDTLAMHQSQGEEANRIRQAAADNLNDYHLGQLALTAGKEGDGEPVVKDIPGTKNRYLYSPKTGSIHILGEDNRDLKLGAKDYFNFAKTLGTATPEGKAMAQKGAEMLAGNADKQWAQDELDRMRGVTEDDSEPASSTDEGGDYPLPAAAAATNEPARSRFKIIQVK